MIRRAVCGPLWIVARPDGASWALPSLGDARKFMSFRGYPREWFAGSCGRGDLGILWSAAQVLPDWRGE